MIKEELKAIFLNVNDWLKFAEAKHAGILVLNSGIVFGELTIYKDYSHCLSKGFVIVSLLFLGLSMLFSLLSLFPKTENSVKPKNKIKSPNLYFAEHLSQMTVQNLREQLAAIDSTHKFDRFDDDLINQIIVNSGIASRKYALFKFAVISTLAGLGVPLLNFLINLLCQY